MTLFSMHHGSPASSTISHQSLDSDEESASSRASSRSYIRSSGIAPFPGKSAHSSPSRSKHEDQAHTYFPKSARSSPSHAKHEDKANTYVPKSAHFSPSHSKHEDHANTYDHKDTPKHEINNGRRSTSSLDQAIPGKAKAPRPPTAISTSLSDKDKILSSNSNQTTNKKPTSRELLLERGGYDHSKYEDAKTPAVAEGQGGVDLDNQSQEYLENYAIKKSEETTAAIRHALKIADDTTDIATKTTIQLHQQGEQMRKTHNTAVVIDMELKRGEKLLGSLGGLFSRKWKPKSNHAVVGPVTNHGKDFKSKAYALEKRAALGLNNPKTKVNDNTYTTDESSLQSRLQVEKKKQDDALSELSDAVLHLKEMSMDIASEIERQGEGLEPFHKDIDELNFRMKGANERGRKLLYS